MDMPEHSVETLIVGGGQAGLATAFHLQRRYRDFIVLDAAKDIGRSWQNRWDSLRLFTPAGFSHLPGMTFQEPRGESPTKDAMADYLRAYADHFGIPVTLDTRVEAVHRDGTDLLVTAGQQRWRAHNVVVATGAHCRPFVPEAAAKLSPHIIQLHSSDYRRPEQLPAGATVLVIGAGNSGAEIALDLALAATGGRRRVVYLAGRNVGHIPRLGPWTYPLMQLLGRAGSAISQRGLRGGADPLGRIRPGALEAAGVIRLPKVSGARNGLPITEDGKTIKADAVLWCTGLKPDYRFVQLPVFDAAGHLIHNQGVTDEPGLYVVGVPHQSSITSHLVGGVGKDAQHIVKHLTRRSPELTTRPAIG
jgi:putative flavoprotein involved in K+ transport